jgi:uncharacterized protein YidB (DUF937 family)
MAIFDAIKGAMGGGNPLQAAMGELLNGQELGGLGGILDKIKGAGLGDLVNGWIQTGPNPGISADQITKALGADTLSAIASKFGLPLDQLSGGLSANLPNIVDQLTPDGKMPDLGALQGQLGGLLGGLFGKG